MTYYDAACVHAALAASALEDQGKPSAERQSRPAGPRSRSGTPRQGAETGEFKGMIRLDEIRREPTLDLLRANPRFQLLILDLAFLDNPLRSAPAND